MTTTLERPAAAAAPATFARDPLTAAEARSDVWVGLALFVGAVISLVLGYFAQMFGSVGLDIRWGLLYAAALSLPFVMRRRHPILVAIVVNVVYIVGMEAGATEAYVGQIALFLSMYTVGAWVDDRRRAQLVRLGIIAAMFVWL